MPLSGAAKNLQTATGVVNIGSAAAPSANQVLTATSSTAATWQAAGGGVMTLLVAASGETTIATAENVSTVAISGLTAKDTIVIYLNLISVTAQTAGPMLYNDTDSVNIVALNAGSAIAGGERFQGTANIRQSQAGDTTIHGVSIGMKATTIRGIEASATFTTAWTG